jgi:L-alanine-DL-glutamate epimerase-like enolase superfamily enzyme
VHALSGVDIALWDIRGKAESRSVAELLGGRRRGRVPVYFPSSLPDSVDETRRVAREAKARGFCGLKLGWGNLGQDDDADEARVGAAREELGAEMALMVDAGMSYSLEQAQRMAARYARHAISWLEDPLSPDDHAGYAALCATSPVPIAAGEEDATLWDFEDLIDRAGVHIIQPDLTRCGGYTELRRIAQAAQQRGRTCGPHVSSTGVSLAATLQFNAFQADTVLQEWSQSESPLNRALTRPAPRFRDGHLMVPDGPGIGVEIDEEVMERHRLEVR